MSSLNPRGTAHRSWWCCLHDACSSCVCLEQSPVSMYWTGLGLLSVRGCPKALCSRRILTGPDSSQALGLGSAMVSLGVNCEISPLLSSTYSDSAARTANGAARGGATRGGESACCG
eukprot:TRINITY_DN11231_c0_g1_i1.p1 TRINITY_DN11231_c0_g1~~TRINITY_DN11231_c0_g1_i1.p1  ORF type:complete len:117 (-),score=8.62 TRINITY_DN11231_c0_g1_i1:67-417(-)